LFEKQSLILIKDENFDVEKHEIKEEIPNDPFDHCPVKVIVKDELDVVGIFCETTSKLKLIKHKRHKRNKNKAAKNDTKEK
jgi:hypothetical protein